MDYRKLKATAFAVGGLSAGVALTLFGVTGARAQAPAPAAQAAAAQPVAKKAVPKQSAEAKAAKKDPAQALQTIEQAQKLLQSGKADNAVSTLSGVISGGNLPGNVMARALYVRGLAHRKMTKPALAISDLQSALWIKNGLTDNERTDALQNRAAAYRDAGLPDQADDSIKTASATPPAAKSAAPVQAAAPTAATPAAAPSPAPVALASEPAAPAPQQASASGLGGIFGNLFNGGGAATTPAVTTPEQAEAKRQLRRDEAAAARSVARQASPITTNSVPTQEPKPAVQPAVSSSPPAPIPAQAAATAAPKQKVAAAAGPAASTAPQAATGGSTRLQLGLVRTEAEARASALKVQQLLGAAAGAVSIDQTQVGSMGTFYRVRMGAFPSESAGAQQCAKVKAAGVDCIPLAQ